jgi:uncharacterized protein (TIGR00661 family)
MDDLKDLRVLFSPCGIGLGHVSRSVVIAKELINRGSIVQFSTYLDGIDYVRKNDLSFVEAPKISLANDPTGSIDLKASTISTGISAIPTFMDQVSAEIKFIKSFEPDLVFSDSRISSIYAAKLLKIPVALILNQFLPRIPRGKDNNYYRFLDGAILTILGYSWALSDVIIIPDFPEPYTISLDSLRIPEKYNHKVRFVGAILPKKTKDVKSSELRKRLGVSEDEILIYAGISGPQPERIPLIRKLQPILKDLPKEYKVVMSMGNPSGGSKPEIYGGLIKIPWIEDRFEYLKSCDLIISRGGHETIMQSISYMKPSILIPVPNHPEQYGNVRRAQELGVAVAMHQKDLDKANLSRVIQQVTKRNLKLRLEKMSQEISLSNGLTHTIDALRKLLY